MSYSYYSKWKPGCGSRPHYIPNPCPPKHHHPCPDPCPHPKPPPPPPPPTQTHTHEFLGSTMLAGDIIHNHRFAGVTSEEIPKGKSHVHAILTNTDFFVSHLHEVGVETGPAIPVGKGRHVHFVYGYTTLNAGHVHEFILATLIENPIQPEKKHDDKKRDDYYDDRWDDHDDVRYDDRDDIRFEDRRDIRYDDRDDVRYDDDYDLR